MKMNELLQQRERGGKLEALKEQTGLDSFAPGDLDGMRVHLLTPRRANAEAFSTRLGLRDLILV